MAVSARQTSVWPPGIGWSSGLPVPLTPLVGRSQELAEVRRLVSSHRLVTLTGVGGVGKTRLAVEVAGAVAGGVGGEPALIYLGVLSDPLLLPSAVARGVGMEEWGGADLEDRLIRVLRGQHRLLLIDN